MMLPLIRCGGMQISQAGKRETQETRRAAPQISHLRCGAVSRIRD